MQKLHEAYDTKKTLYNNNSINDFGEILRNNSEIDTVNINPDNTIYIESKCKIDSMIPFFELSIMKVLNNNVSFPINMIFNTLPINDNICILHI